MTYCRLSSSHIALTTQVIAVCAETSLSWGSFYELASVPQFTAFHSKNTEGWWILNDLEGSDRELIDLPFVISFFGESCWHISFYFFRKEPGKSLIFPVKAADKPAKFESSSSRYRYWALPLSQSTRFRLRQLKFKDAIYCCKWEGLLIPDMFYYRIFIQISLFCVKFTGVFQ